MINAASSVPTQKAPVQTAAGKLNLRETGTLRTPGATAAGPQQPKKPLPWKLILAGVVFGLLLIGGIVAFYLSQQSQDVRQQAAGGGGGCVAPQVMVNGKCTTPSTGGTATCSSGQKKCENNVSYTCMSGKFVATGGCVSTPTTPACKTGDKKCENNVSYTCMNGKFSATGGCVSPQPGKTLCGGLYVDISTDRNNCGACGMKCPTGAGCSKGICGSAPAPAPKAPTGGGGTPAPAPAPQQPAPAPAPQQPAPAPSTTTACGGQHPVVIRFRKETGADTEWLATLTGLKANDKIEVNCFAKGTGTDLLANGYIEQKIGTGAFTKVSTINSQLDNFTLTTAGDNQFRCRTTNATIASTCIVSATLSVAAAEVAAAAATPTPTPTTTSAADAGIHRGCNEYCANTGECDTAYTCYSNKCRPKDNVLGTSCSNTPDDDRTATAQPAQTQSTPVSGAVENTIALAGAGVLFLISGGYLALNRKKY